MARLYTITGQLQTRALVGQQLQDVYEIHYAGPSNVAGYVRVPVAAATPEQVDELIRRQLDKQLGIAQLGSDGQG